MSDLIMNIQVNNKKVSVKLLNTTDNNIADALRRSFDLLQSVEYTQPKSDPMYNEPLVSTPIGDMIARTNQRMSAAFADAFKGLKPTEDKHSDIIKPDLIGSERTLTTSIADAFDKATKPVEQEPDHYTTGIKVKDGVPHYRCRIYCKNPNCWKRSTRYIAANTNATTCRHCKAEHVVIPASAPGQRDEEGKFYLANRLIGEVKSS